MWDKVKWVVIGLAILIFGWVVSCADAEQTAKFKAANDSLNVALDSTVSTVKRLDSVNVELSNASLHIDTLWKTRTIHVVDAAVHEASADSLIQLVPPDTAHVCKAITMAYNERTTECAQLKIAIGIDSQTIRSADSTIRVANAQIIDARAAAQDATNKLKFGIKETKCKIVFIPCPSRNLSTLLGFIAGGTLVGVIK